jgi:iron complex transport system ATP-binding protein
MIKIKKAAFSYSQKEIFKDLTLDLRKGEVVCLIGPNGVGKSTLLDCVLKLRRVNSGDIIIGKKTLQEYSIKDLAQNIAYVPQTRDQTFSYSVEEMVLMGRAAYLGIFDQPTESDYEKTREAIEMVGLIGYEKRDYRTLSGGEAQLVILARALVQETPIIIMDEPTAHLDYHHELKILEIIGRLATKKHLSILMATHFPNHAFYFQRMGVPTRVGILHKEHLVALGEPEEVITKENLKKVFRIDSEMIQMKEEWGQQSHMIPIKTTEEVT